MRFFPGIMRKEFGPQESPKFILIYLRLTDKQITLDTAVLMEFCFFFWNQEKACFFLRYWYVYYRGWWSHYLDFLLLTRESEKKRILDISLQGDVLFFIRSLSTTFYMVKFFAFYFLAKYPKYGHINFCK